MRRAPVTARQNTTRFWTDSGYWLAVLAAPLCWWLMTLAGITQRVDTLSLRTVLIVILISPVLEEIVFRGGLQGLLLGRTGLSRSCAGISIANILTSIAFAALHLLNQSALWAALVFIPSLVFGWARERHDSLVSPILLHIFYNAGFVFLFQ